MAVSSPLDPVPQRDAANEAMGQPDRSDWWMTSYQHLLRGGVPWAKSPKRSWGFGIYSPGAGVGVGAALGVAFGAAVDHLALGLALGTAFGAAADVVSHARQMNIKKPR